MISSPVQVVVIDSNFGIKGSIRCPFCLVVVRKICFVFALWFVVLSAEPMPNSNCTLGIRPIGQEGHLLCWAACTQMIMEHYHSIDTSAHVMSQFELAKLWYGVWLESNPRLSNKQIDSILHSLAGNRSTIPAQIDRGGVPFDYGNPPSPDSSYVIRSLTEVAWDT